MSVIINGNNLDNLLAQFKLLRTDVDTLKQTVEKQQREIAELKTNSK